VYTQSLVVPAEGLARFANNPLSVLRAALAHGAIRIYATAPARLEPFDLPGRASAVDEAALAQAVEELGPARLAGLLAAVLREHALGLAGERRRPKLIAGLLACLPPACRTDLTFTTGLKTSPRRPFRVQAVARDPVEVRRCERQLGLTVIDLDCDLLTAPAPDDGWAGLIGWVLAKGKVPRFAQVVAGLRQAVDQAGLAGLAATIRRELECKAGPAGPRPMADTRASVAEVARHAAPAAPAPAVVGPRPAAAAASHAGSLASFAGGGVALHVLSTAPHPSDLPSEALRTRLPRAGKTMQLLEDAIFETLAGKRAAMAEVEAAWATTMAVAGPSLAGELRERFLRLTVALWRQLGDEDPGQHHLRAAAVLDVVGLMLGPAAG
jgi:hypothetical protein